MNQEIQKSIDDQAAATGAARVTPADIDAEIASEHYFTAADGVGHRCPTALHLLTFCVLVLKNGFTVVGKSACVDPAMFDAEIGCKVALADAKSQMWALLGFRLRDRFAAAIAHGDKGCYDKRPLGNPHGL